MGALRLVGWLGAGLLLLFLGGEIGGVRGVWVAAGLTLFVALNGLANGSAALCFQDIVGKIVPLEKRERFFGLRMFFGRILQTAVTFFWIPFLLTGQEWLPYPRNHALLFLSAFFFATLSVTTFCLVREPAGTNLAPRKGMVTHVRDGFHLLKGEPNFRLLLLFRVCTHFGIMAIPLLTVFALDGSGGLGLGLGSDGHPDPALRGEAQVLFIRTFVIAECVTAGLWAWLGHRFSVGAGLMVGTCSRLTMSIAATAAGPLLWHLDASRDARMWVVAGIYVLQGISTMTLFIEQEALVLALAPEDRRPTFIGFLNTLSFPLFLGCPVLGGVLAGVCGYAVAFGAMLIFNVGGIVVAAALGRAKQEAWLAAAAQSDMGRTATEK
jgi:hypothetical protein